MVERDIAGRGITDERVLSAMRTVPREEFVPGSLRGQAYADAPLPIGDGQTISQPYIVALMVDALELAGEEGDTALDVGTGSGYAAAVLSHLVERVFTIERHVKLAREARDRLERLGYDNVEVRRGDGSRGWPAHAPYRAILVSAAANAVPAPLREQLAIEGRLVIPVVDSGFLSGLTGAQRLLRITRRGPDRYDEDTLTSVRFVPLVSGDGTDVGPGDGRDVEG